MNAYQKAQALGLSGTNAEIVAQLTACGLTARPIQLSELLFLLNFRGMLTKLVSNQTDEKWTGTVLSMKAAQVAANQTESVASLDRWLSHITNPRNVTFDTTSPAHAAPFWAMRIAFGGVPTMPTLADFDAVADLGGGWLFATLTEQQYAAQKAAAIAAENAETLSNEWNAHLNETINPAIATGSRQSVITAVTAVLAELSE